MGRAGRECERSESQPGGARAPRGGKSLEKEQSRTGVPGEMKSVVMREGPKGQKAQPTQRVGCLKAKQRFIERIGSFNSIGFLDIFPQFSTTPSLEDNFYSHGVCKCAVFHAS